MTTITITKLAERNRYYATIDSIVGEAYIDYNHISEDIISASHTWADQLLRGTGIAKALVDFMIEDARKHNLKIIPACPYIAYLYQRNPEWGDVMVDFG